MKRYQKRAYDYMMRWNVRVHKQAYFTTQEEIEKTWAAGYRAAIRDVLGIEDVESIAVGDGHYLDVIARCDIERLVEE